MGLMQTLLIAPRSLHNCLTDFPHLWSENLFDAKPLMAINDVDAIIFDDRVAADHELCDLLSNISLTTRVLALVEQLPSEPLCSVSGVVFLTPPINVADINWFIRSGVETEAALK